MPARGRLTRNRLDCSTPPVEPAFQASPYRHRNAHAIVIDRFPMRRIVNATRMEYDIAPPIGRVIARP